MVVAGCSMARCGQHSMSSEWGEDAVGLLGFLHGPVPCWPWAVVVGMEISWWSLVSVSPFRAEEHKVSILPLQNIWIILTWDAHCFANGFVWQALFVTFLGGGSSPSTTKGCMYICCHVQTLPSSSSMVFWWCSSRASVGLVWVQTFLCEQRESWLSQAVLCSSPYTFGIYKCQPL